MRLLFRLFNQIFELKQMKFFRNDKNFFKKYCILILILNFVVLAISLILYPLLLIGIIVPIFGNIFGVLFLCNIFANLLFMQINSKFLIKTSDKGKIINRVTYCYLFFLIFGVLPLFSISGPIVIQNYIISLIIYLFPIVISYYELTIIDKKEGIFRWEII